MAKKKSVKKTNPKTNSKKQYSFKDEAEKLKKKVFEEWKRIAFEDKSSTAREKALQKITDWIDSGSGNEQTVYTCDFNMTEITMDDNRNFVVVNRLASDLPKELDNKIPLKEKVQGKSNPHSATNNLEDKFKKPDANKS